MSASIFFCSPPCSLLAGDVFSSYWMKKLEVWDLVMEKQIIFTVKYKVEEGECVLKN